MPTLWEWPSLNPSQPSTIPYRRTILPSQRQKLNWRHRSPRPLTVCAHWLRSKRGYKRDWCRHSTDSVGSLELAKEQEFERGSSGRKSLPCQYRPFAVAIENIRHHFHDISDTLCFHVAAVDPSRSANVQEEQTQASKDRNQI